MKRYYPIAVSLNNKEALVAGGGKVAERKIISLLKAGARVKVVAPTLTARLAHLAKKRKIAYLKKTIGPVDIEAADIIIAATSDRAVNKKVSVLARNAGKLVNIVDDKGLSSFISPAVLKVKRAIIAVYTDGIDPVLARDLKNFIKEYWDEFLHYRDRL